MPSPKIDVRKARSLCTASEFELVMASGPKTLPSLSPARLQQKIDRARRLRDKWKGQAKAGRRKAQAEKGRRSVDASTRSREKAELFNAVLERFQAAAAKQGGAGAKATKKSVAKKSKSAARAAKPGKKTAKKSAKSSAKKASAKKAGKKKPRKAVAHDPLLDSGGAHLAIHPARRGGDLRPGGGADAAQFDTAPQLRLTPAKGSVHVPAPPSPAGIQRLLADDVVKQRRLARSGIRSRVRGQVSAHVRRAQARRDSQQSQG
ncbi:MAG: hypothetical protein IBJ10_00060 [Phycisphaerales bacterium]|nr:hypothetical protein [Phycisphaerales bacterium]